MRNSARISSTDMAATCIEIQARVPDKFAEAGRLVRLLGMCGPGTMVRIAHRHGSRPSQTVGRADSQRIAGISRR